MRGDVRIAILGNSCCGKSTIAGRLADRYRIPLIFGLLP